jgi:chlorobactene glucosyltransferase
MSGFFIIVSVGLGIIALVWLTRHLEISRARRCQRLLSSGSYEGPPGKPPRVSVLVAAKDEEENIEDCMVSLCEQDYPDFEVVVVDDRSTDATPAILRRLESRYNGKLRLVTVQRLRDGWFGKNNAMREGVAVAKGQWLCFADADCRQTSRRTLSMALSEAVTQGTDFLSVLPVLETRTFWERIIHSGFARIG